MLFNGIKSGSDVKLAIFVPHKKGKAVDCFAVLR